MTYNIKNNLCLSVVQLKLSARKQFQCELIDLLDCRLLGSRLWDAGAERPLGLSKDHISTLPMRKVWTLWTK